MSISAGKILVIFFAMLIFSIIFHIWFITFLKEDIEKKTEEIKKQCKAKRFELLDILFIPNALYTGGQGGNDFKIIPIIRIIDTGEVYCIDCKDNDSYSNHIPFYTWVGANIYGLKINRKSRNDTKVEVAIGDTGYCYIKSVQPFVLQYVAMHIVASIPGKSFNKKKYGTCVYAGSIKENNNVRLGEYRNYNENVNVVESIQDLKQMKGVIEFDEI